MSILQTRSDVFSTNGAFAASSCGAAALPQPTFGFGFQAAGLILSNTCGPGRIFYDLTGAAATTAQGVLTSGQVLQVGAADGFKSCGLGLTTTSTTTATGTQPVYSVTAWASA